MSDSKTPSSKNPKKQDDPSVGASDYTEAEETQQSYPQVPEDEQAKAEAIAKARQAATDNWALQVDRMAISMPLIESLKTIAGFYGRRTSVSALTAGLPIPPAGITPYLMVRAAERADLSAKLAERPLESLIIAPNLPCILALKHRQACILWEVKHAKGQKTDVKPGQLPEAHPETSFIVQFPETPDERQELRFEELKELYTGYAFFARPVARSDDRAGPAEIDTGRDWFWGVFKKNRTIYYEVGIAAIMINLFGIASSLFVMNVYDRVVPNNAIDTLWALTIGICIVYGFDFLLRLLRANFLDHAGRRADIKISASLFEQIMGMTMKDRPPSAGVLAANMKEFEGLRDFFTSATMVAIIDLPFVLLYIAIIAIIGGHVAWVPLSAIPLIVGVGLVLRKPLERIMKQSLHESALKNALLFETIIGLETIKVQAAEGHTQRRWEELTEKSSLTSVRSRQVSTLAQSWAMLIQQLVSVFIVVVGVNLISGGSITMGGLIACVILSGRAMGPLAQVAGLMTRYAQSKQALDQLDNLMKKGVERPVGKYFIPMPDMKGRIEFRDVVFRYPGQQVPALNNVSFIMQPGDRVGVIGAVGSGKTTIERLLLNLYEPESGTVQIDGTDVRQIDPGDLRRSVGAVQQSPQLFFGSVRQNITMGHEAAAGEAVYRAAEQAGVMEFLRDSSAGLDTQVGERGEALSGGQRQAVAIARSLLYDPPIMIMDEPTAAMDPASEARLKKRLSLICENKTTIIITHKGSMLSLVNKLILMDRGKIVAYGPRDEVIKKLQERKYGSTAENTSV